MISKIKLYSSIGGLILLICVVLFVVTKLHYSKNKIKELQETNSHLSSELTLIKEQVKELRLRLDTIKVSEKVTDSYVEKKDEITTKRDKIKDEIQNVIVNEKEACDWWNTRIPDTISSVLNASKLLYRNEVCDEV